MQRANRRHHSTETPVLKIVSDILCAADRGYVAFLCLLDVSAAFDTVDHDIIVEHLEKAFDLRGQVLERIKSFLYRRTQTVTRMGNNQHGPSCNPEFRRAVYSARSYSSCICYRNRNSLWSLGALTRRRHTAKISQEG